MTRSEVIAHIRDCRVCCGGDDDILAELDNGDLSTDELNDYAQTAHEWARRQRRLALLNR